MAEASEKNNKPKQPEKENNSDAVTSDADQSPEKEVKKSNGDKTGPARIIPIDRIGIKRLMQLDACTRCGECLNWGPVYDQDNREEVIPRTKILDFLRIVKSQHGLLSRFMKSGKAPEALKKSIRKFFRLQEITDDMVVRFAENLYECSTCGQCKVVCPADIDTVDLWEDIRQLIVEAGYGPLESQKVLVKSVKAYDNPWQQPRQGRTKWARHAKKENLIINPPRDIKKTNAKILLFFGCTAVYDSNVRQLAINTVNIFESLDVDYGCLGGDEKCCGSVLLRMGDPEFERVATDNINQINELNIDTLVTSCAGCYKTLKEDYPKVAKLNFEVLHTVEYLHRLIDEGKLEFVNPVNKKVTYHDPCHLGRIAGVFDSPRKILESIPGLEFVEMDRHEEYSRCCGAGGGVKAGFPDLQSKMALRRIEEAESTGAEELISACPFCYAGLQVGIRAKDSNLVMNDITSLVAESLMPGSQTGEALPETEAPPEKEKEDKREKRKEKLAARKKDREDKPDKEEDKEEKRRKRREKIAKSKKTDDKQEPANDTDDKEEKRRKRKEKITKSKKTDDKQEPANDTDDKEEKRRKRKEKIRAGKK